MASPQALIDRIWSGVEWKSRQAGIEGLTIEYDDGWHQSVQLCVGSVNCHEAVSIMRFRESASRISFFYSRPPKGVVAKTGVWEACAVAGGCRLRLVRSLQLQRGQAESAASFRVWEKAYGAVLKEHLGRVFDSVA